MVYSSYDQTSIDCSRKFIPYRAMGCLSVAVSRATDKRKHSTQRNFLPSL